MSKATKLDLKGLLNPAQLEAATHEGGPLLIIAGAGSGKTRTLVHRVAWLVSCGADPRKILLLTFTRKAAGEMLGRSAELVGPAAGRVAGGTFHSVANVLLRSEHRLTGFPAGFGILDQDDAESLVNRIREAVPGSKERQFPKKGKILQVISRAANKEISVKEAVMDHFPHLKSFTPAIEWIAGRYGEEKLRQAVMDFDDLLVNLSSLMIREPSARERIAARYDHVLVDEYQDTNPVQARIAWLLAKDHRNITAVGDDAQSIYGFRGADFRNIMDFPGIFAPARILKLEENYRSFGSILKVADGVFKGARERYDKTLRAVRDGGPLPLLVVPEDLKGEARWASGRIRELLKGGTPPKEIAVLFRASAHSFELELALTRANVPYTKYGGRKFLEGAHVKDFLAFLRVAHNPADETNLARILRMLPGVGAKGAADAAAWVGGDRERLLDFGQAPLRGGKAAAAKGRLAALLKKICGDGDRLGTRPKSVLAYYRPLMKELYPDDHPDRLEDIEELCGMAEAAGSLAGYLADVTLDPPNSASTGGDTKGPRNDVTLSTVHSAKGLEWGHVFILSAVDGRMPSSYSLQKPDELEEERRLLYVAVTRAKDELYLMCPAQTPGGWEGEPSATYPSRFLAGLPAGAVDVIKVTGGRASKGAYKSLFPGYLGWGASADDRGDGAFSDGDGWGPGFSGDSQLSEALPPPEKRAAASLAPRGEPVPEPRKGDRVGHGTFGTGVVISFRDGKALIDFDTFGRKTIHCRHAKLYRA